jgi:diguanylate cyclase (GGDEF)-like protein
MKSRSPERRILVRPSRSDSEAGVPPMSAAAPNDAGEPQDEAVDLVGWATHRLTGSDEASSPEARRALLATALGVPLERLERVGDAEVDVALGRLRGLIAEINRLEAAAAIDELTGALRRGAGLHALEREIARFRRFGGKGVAAIFIDVDGLKNVNDTEGHPAGDALLGQVVAALRERLRAYDLVIRWGGDEFICVLPDASHGEAERTLADIEEHVRIRTSGRTVSTGLAALEEGDTADTLLGRADEALLARRDPTRTRA